jgi:hypothetical protein
MSESTENELLALQNILSVDILAQSNKDYYNAGMPRNLVLFGYDCMGNAYCFERIESFSVRPDDVPIFIFDHDSIEVTKVAESFENFLLFYISLEK